MNKQHIESDAVFRFGDSDDLAVGLPIRTPDDHVIEASYFAGTAKPKGIMVISSQASCPLTCSFCDLGDERRWRNLSVQEMVDQFWLLRNRLREQGIDASAQSTKLTVANSGEPLLNPRLTYALQEMPYWIHSFKISTALPAAAKAMHNLEHLAYFARQQDRPVQLQISLISTDAAVRREMGGKALAGFAQIREAGVIWHRLVPGGRKVNLSLLVSACMPCEAADVIKRFPPELFRFRLREYVPTGNGQDHGMSAPGERRFSEILDDFREQGYEISDAGRPTPTERRFRLAANSFRRMYRQACGQLPEEGR